MTVFRSIEDVEKHYFPEQFKKNQWDKMTPEEKGRALATETIEKIDMSECHQHKRCE